MVRDGAGRLTAFKGTKSAPGALRESVIYVHVERIDEQARRAEIVEAIERVLADVRVCVADWRAMVGRVAEEVAELTANPPPLPPVEIAEAIAFLEWLLDNNFTFLGIRDYGFTASQGALEPIFESGLGILRSRDMAVLRRWNEPLTITPEIRALLKQPTLLIVTKATVRSRVHRRVYMDYVGVKRFDRNGKLLGEFRIVGLFTSTAYTRSTRSIPYLRRKVDAVVKRAGFDPDSHSGKALVNVLENYPRDELFQLDEDTLYEFALAVLQLDERPRVRVLSASTSSSRCRRAKRRIRIGPASSARSKRLCAPGSTSLARRWPAPTIPLERARCSSVIATPSRKDTGRTIRPPRRSAIFASSKGSRRLVRSASIFIGAAPTPVTALA